MMTRSRHGSSFAQGSGQKRPRSQQREEVRLHRRADHMVRPPAPVRFTSGFHANAAVWKAVVLRLSAHKVGPQYRTFPWGVLRLVQPHQVAGIVIGQRPQQRRITDAEMAVLAPTPCPTVSMATTAKPAARSSPRYPW